MIAPVEKAGVVYLRPICIFWQKRPRQWWGEGGRVGAHSLAMRQPNTCGPLHNCCYCPNRLTVHTHTCSHLQVVSPHRRAAAAAAAYGRERQRGKERATRRGVKEAAAQGG